MKFWREQKEKTGPAFEEARHWGVDPSAFIQSPAYMAGSYIFKIHILNYTQEGYSHDEKIHKDLRPEDFE
ncbi:MAG: hypothetical protein NPIRA02_26880 [Nitrospirales bacterium]|nr:MAG: hypothetical protein NPIRA02_26880 [Nitrospirales bacterium]